MRNVSLSSVRRNRDSNQRGGSPGRPQRRLGLLAVFALVAALLGAAPAASSQELLSGVADESGTAGPRWTRTFFTPETTRDHTLTLAWTGGGNLSMAVRIVATNQWVDDANTSNNPEVITTELTAGVEYKIAVWAVSGVGTYTLTVDDEPTSGLELLSGVADESGTAGPRWTRTFFTPETTRDHTLTLAWTGGGNLSMAVRIAATNQWVDDANTSNNPEVITTELTAGVEYKIAVWAVSGVGTYTLSVDGPQPSGGLTIQRNHLDAAAGPAEISAVFTPTTSGPVTIELSWTGAADLDLIVERADNGAVAGESMGSDNPERVVADVIPGVEYRIRSIAVSGATDFGVSLAGDRVRATPPAGAPNILIINVDDARTDTLEVMDAVMRWFGDDGTFYPNGYITTPACCPSCAVSMSGQYNHNNGQIEQNVEHLDEADTLQHYLYDAGYLTGHTGKFLHYVDTSRRGLYWDRWNYFKGGYYDVWMNRDGYGYRPAGYSTVITFDRAIEFAEDFDSFEDDRPWLLHVTPIAPHRPSLPEEKYEDAPVPEWSPDPSVGEADRSDKPPFVRNFNYSPAEGEAERAEMLRTLMSVDEQVDRLMTRARGARRGQHAGHLHVGQRRVVGRARLAREVRAVPASHRCSLPDPLAGHVAVGAVDDRSVVNIDIAPTVLAAAGVSSKHPMDGSRHPSRPGSCVRGGSPSTSSTRPTASACRAGHRSDRTPSSTPSTTTRPARSRSASIYDLVADPYELVNLLETGTREMTPTSPAFTIS